jgi:hypothetical protein
MLEDFLSKLGASTRITVGVSVSPGVGLEMIEVDRISATVNKYANRPLDYNFSTREITDYDQFATALEELFEELRIPKRSNIVLNLPNVHFGMIKLPLLLTDDAITNAIVSEVEQSYIFKRLEPIVSWAEIFSNQETESRSLAYTALQDNAYENIIEKCTEIGCTVVRIENSYSSLLKTLHFSGLTKEQMKDNFTWNLMIIGQNSYSIISMFEKKIMEYYEEPLALKSFIDDEIYNAITTSAQMTLAGLPANCLFIISETDLVSAEVLSLKINAGYSVKFLECNKFAQSEIISVNLNVLPNLALQITPEAIGAGISTFSDFPLKLNTIKEKGKDLDSGLYEEEVEVPTINVGGLEIELTAAFVKRFAAIVAGVTIVPMIVLWILLSTLVIPKEQARLDALDSQISTINAEIAKYKKPEQNAAFDLTTAINNIIQQNTKKLDYYSALGISVPSKLWITYYNLNGDGKIDLKGQASDVKSIYVFYKNLKDLVNNSDIKLYKLQIDSGSIDDIVTNSSNSVKIYDFEITNMTDAELNPTKSSDDKSKTGDAQTQQQTPAPQPQQGTTGGQKPLFNVGKPLFGQGNGGNGNTSPTPGANISSPPAAGGSNPPAGGSSGGGALPANLQKIEKF